MRLTHMKQKAELYLIEECTHIRPIIFRPGKVYLNTLFERTFEGLHNRAHYSSIDSVTAGIVNEIVSIFNGEKPPNQTNDPFFFGDEDFKHSKL